MGINAIVFGAALIGLGLYGFVDTGSTHYTALIPAVIGIILAGLGAVALQGGAARKHAMHAAAAIALLGFAGSVSGVFGLIKMMNTSPEDQIKAGVSQATTPGQVAAEKEAKSGQYMAAVCKSAMAALCLIFVGLCVKSFIDARVARQAEASPPSAPPPQATPA